jgi:hypothetical protein
MCRSDSLPHRLETCLTTSAIDSLLQEPPLSAGCRDLLLVPGAKYRVKFIVTCQGENCAE